MDYYNSLYLFFICYYLCHVLAQIKSGLTMTNQVNRAMNKCDGCGRESDLKLGWNNCSYCSESCERSAISRLHGSMPGGALPRLGWLPSHVAAEITARWATESGE